MILQYRAQYSARESYRFIILHLSGSLFIEFFHHIKYILLPYITVASRNVRHAHHRIVMCIPSYFRIECMPSKIQSKLNSSMHAQRSRSGLFVERIRLRSLAHGPPRCGRCLHQTPPYPKTRLPQPPFQCSLVIRKTALHAMKARLPPKKLAF